MANGKTTLEQFKKFDPATRDYYIWNKLEILDCLDQKYASKGYEKVLIWIGFGFGSIIIGAIAKLIFIS